MGNQQSYKTQHLKLYQEKASCGGVGGCQLVSLYFGLGCKEPILSKADKVLCKFMCWQLILSPGNPAAGATTGYRFRFACPMPQGL